MTKLQTLINKSLVNKSFFLTFKIYNSYLDFLYAVKTAKPLGASGIRRELGGREHRGEGGGVEREVGREY